MNIKHFRGLEGEKEFEKVLSDNFSTSSQTCNSSFGYFQDVFHKDGKPFTAIVPNCLNRGGENFYGTIEEISEVEAKRLVFSGLFYEGK